MKNCAVVKSDKLHAGDLVRYWDEWNEVYHVGIVIGEDACTSKMLDHGYLIYFAGSIPGYLQPVFGDSDRMIFSCHQAMLEKIR